MKYILFLTSLIAVCIAMGCGSASSEDKTETTPATTAANTATSPQTIQATIPTNSTTTNTTVTTTPAAAPVINNIQQPGKSGATTSGLNPAHGQPGHRCEIGVGAPLDSKPSTNATTPVVTTSTPVVTTKTTPSTTAPAMTPVNTPATSTKTAAGVNPAHGQPGHRCEIAVGAPLDSKPMQQPTVTTTQTPQKALPYTPITPATNPQPASKTMVAEGMNPEHGKPGHRCDIAVGAPLNSKPKQ